MIGAMSAPIVVGHDPDSADDAGPVGSLDLLVMGSRAYGQQRAVLLGGVSRRVIAAARCTVLVLPRGATHPLRELLAQRAA
jgi:nucleotide-binding universal stress UspA family protein